jgi:DNA-binding MarR family transcriptional regulator
MQAGPVAGRNGRVAPAAADGRDDHDRGRPEDTSTGGHVVNGGAGGEQFETDVAHIVALYREVGRGLRAGEPADLAGNVTMPQLRVLNFLGLRGASSVGEVAAGVGVAQPSATEMLDKLVRHGLVERTPDPCDRRVVRNALTPAGRDSIDRPWQLRRAALASALRCATPEEKAAIAHGLVLLSRALQRSTRTERGPDAQPVAGGTGGTGGTGNLGTVGGVGAAGGTHTRNGASDVGESVAAPGPKTGHKNKHGEKGSNAR